MWPLVGQSKREAQLWRRLWGTPQSTAWEQMVWTDTVARYTRVLAAAEQRGAAAGILAEARQLEDRLGLSPMAMLRLRWEIADQDLGHPPDGDMLDIRQRLRAIE